MARAPGIPNFKPTDTQREQVKMMAAIGTPHELIAKLIKNGEGGPSISVDTLVKHFASELEHGLEEAKTMVVGKLMRFINGTNPKANGADELRAIMFFLNTRGGWATTAKVEHDAAEPEELDEVAVAARVSALIEKGLRAGKGKTPTVQ
jgi:hypothetical protein